MLEREIPQKETKTIRRITESEYLSGLGEFRQFWVNKLEEAAENIRRVDKQRLAVDQATFDNQILDFFCEETFDEKGEMVSSRLYHTAKPKGKFGFNINISEKE